MVSDQIVHWSEDMSLYLIGQMPAQIKALQFSVQVFTLVEGLSSSMVMLWNGVAALLMAAWAKWPGVKRTSPSLSCRAAGFSPTRAFTRSLSPRDRKSTR